MTAQAELDAFIERFSPEVAKVARAALQKLRKRLPTAIELVYDNYNALVIGYSPTEKSSDGVLSIVLYPRWVSLFFLRGATLADPSGLLLGSGGVVRHIVLEDAKTIDQPDVQALIDTAVAAMPKPFAATGKRRLMIKSISPKQRPRRPAVTRPAKRR